MFLMPSLYEPCGLTQMFSLKYGTIPLVRNTGGLKDTILDPDEDHGFGTGFKFDRFHSKNLVQMVRRATKVFQNKKRWQAMMLKAMSQDFSWEHSAREYLAVFEQAMAAKKRKK
jgi:starch synthase